MPCNNSDKFELSKNILWKSGKIHKRVSAAVYYAHYPSPPLLLRAQVFLPDRFVSKLKFENLFQTLIWRPYLEADIALWDVKLNFIHNLKIPRLRPLPVS